MKCCGCGGKVWCFGLCNAGGSRRAVADSSRKAFGMTELIRTLPIEDIVSATSEVQVVKLDEESSWRVLALRVQTRALRMLLSKLARRLALSLDCSLARTHARTHARS